MPPAVGVKGVLEAVAVTFGKELKNIATGVMSNLREKNSRSNRLLRIVYMKILAKIGRHQIYLTGEIAIVTRGFVIHVYIHHCVVMGRLIIFSKIKGQGIIASNQSKISCKRIV